MGRSSSGCGSEQSRALGRSFARAPAENPGEVSPQQKRQAQHSPAEIPEETWQGDCSPEAVRSLLQSDLQPEAPSRPEGGAAEARAHLHVYTSVRSLQVLHLT